MLSGQGLLLLRTFLNARNNNILFLDLSTFLPSPHTHTHTRPPPPPPPPQQNLIWIYQFIQIKELENERKGSGWKLVGMPRETAPQIHLSILTGPSFF